MVFRNHQLPARSGHSPGELRRAGMTVLVALTFSQLRYRSPQAAPQARFITASGI
jgi:hypothetical protein